MKHQDSEVRKAAKGSMSVADCMKRLGLTCHGYAHARFRDRLKALGIVIKYDRSRVSRTFNKRKDLSEYLVVNGPIMPTARLRNRLVKAGLLINRCSKCALGPIWQGTKLTIQLDHRNGNRRDNRLKNLRMLCPNCHTQTPTYAKLK